MDSTLLAAVRAYCGLCFDGSDTSGLVASLVTAAVVLQVPAGVLIYLDAKRLNLKDPIAYFYGILVPAGGLVVIPVSLSRRSELPRDSER